jgi:hypothetical protein
MGRVALTAICCLVLATGCARQTPPAPTGSGSTPSSTGTATPTPPSPAPPSSLPPSRALTEARLIAFVNLGTARSGTGAGEVTRPEQLDPFLVGPAAANQKVRDAVARGRTDGVRLFAFLLLGCQNEGAQLMIQPPRMYAVLTGEPKECFAAEQFIAVFAVPAHQVPNGVQLG